jgi:hypothetical protein
MRPKPNSKPDSSTAPPPPAAKANGAGDV